MKVNEIFHSIQGESTYAGCRCVFVRLTGCNLRCSYCDTKYAYEEGAELEIDDIITRVSSYRCPLVEVTGGEPLTQKDTPFLIHRLLQDGYRVLLETNGSLDISQVDDRCVKIVDVKCPSSGESEHNDLENLNRLSGHDELKFVIGNRDDYTFAKQILASTLPGFSIKNTIHFSPVFVKLDPRILAHWILEDQLDVRLHLQQQKFIWPNHQRGV